MNSVIYTSMGPTVKRSLPQNDATTACSGNCQQGRRCTCAMAVPHLSQTAAEPALVSPQASQDAEQLPQMFKLLSVIMLICLLCCALG